MPCTTGTMENEFYRATMPAQTETPLQVIFYDVTTNISKSVRAGHWVGELLYENFSPPNYSESDPLNYMSLPNNNTIQVTDMPRIADCYFQKATPIGSNNFILNFTITATSLQNNPVNDNSGGALTMMFTNLIGTTDYQKSVANNDGLTLSLREYTTSTGVISYIFQLKRPGSTNWGYNGALLNTVYNITIARVGTTVTITISSGGVQLWSASINDTTVINYFVPMCGRGDSWYPTLTATGTTSNYTLTY